MFHLLSVMLHIFKADKVVMQNLKVLMKYLKYLNDLIFTLNN